MHHYESLFSALGQPIAQVLLSADALGSRSHYANAQATFAALLAAGVVPVVNENDSVSISELRFGDNDTLSALVALLVGAEWLFLATDVDALYTANPATHPAATPIREVDDVAAALREVEAAGGGSGSQWGTGGIVTKLRAAQLAAAAGVTTTIVAAKKVRGREAQPRARGGDEALPRPRLALSPSTIAPHPPAPPPARWATCSASWEAPSTPARASCRARAPCAATSAG